MHLPKKMLSTECCWLISKTSSICGLLEWILVVSLSCADVVSRKLIA